MSLEQEAAALCRENQELRALVKSLQARNAQLESQLAKATKNSGNSSKPPSSDIVKPPKPGRSKSRRSIGGQPGHPRHERTAFPPDQVDERVFHLVEECPDCGSRDWETLAEPVQVLQQVELNPKPIKVTEHCVSASRCRNCRKIHSGQLPKAVARTRMVGPRMMGMLLYMKGAQRNSYSGLAEFLEDVLEFRISRGYLAKVMARGSQAVEAPVESLCSLLPEQAVLNVDETGHKENGHLMWTWCFRAPRFVVFSIHDSRGSEVLIEFLGREFSGTLGCDYFSAYRKYMGLMSGLVQFCLAHLIRDLKFLAEHPHVPVQLYGQPILKAVRRMFHLIHLQVENPEEDFQSKLERVKKQILTLTVDTCSISPIEWYVKKEYPEVFNMAQRFRKHGEQYFTFLTTPGVHPTNNVAEQALRFVVMDQRVTQGTRSPKGRTFCERIWTVVGTCRIQKRSIFNYLWSTVAAWADNLPAPSLSPADSS